MKVLDLFSGIGGFSLGLERAGMQTVAFCEIDKKAQLVLKKHWPHVPVYDDVKELNRGRLESDGITGIDVICGGFPCQDISNAGKKVGIQGERSGLWSEIARLIGELRPSYAIMENASALLARGLGRVLGDLAALGYDAEWHCISAAAVGAPHHRDRIWIVAYPNGEWESQQERVEQDLRRRVGNGCEEMADTLRRWPQVERHDAGMGRKPILGPAIPGFGAWEIEPTVGRVVDGLPGRVDRLKQLGNAVVPQIPEMIGLSIMKASQQ